MMRDDSKRAKVIVAAGVLLFIALIVAAFLFYGYTNKNIYGNSVGINNFNQKVGNLSKEFRDSITAALFNIIKINTSGKTNINAISDVVIRDGSNQQVEVVKGEQYTGHFIVDIASIRQSYKVQYTYTTDASDKASAGYPVLVSCLDTKDLIYGDFHCKDTYDSGYTKTDPIIQYLPYQTFDYKIWADTTSGQLMIYANLVIPPSDLTTNLASNQQVVAMYKKEVTDWIQSNGLDPSKYTINYNYDDNGNVIRQ